MECESLVSPAFSSLEVKDLWQFFFWSLKETRIYHPQKCLFDIKIILSWRQLRSSKRTKNFPDPLLFCLNAMICCRSVMSNSLWPLTVACQAPLSMEFSRWEYQSGLPCPPPGDLPNPGIELMSLALQADSLPSEPPGKPAYKFFFYWRQTLTSPKKTLKESANETYSISFPVFTFPRIATFGSLEMLSFVLSYFHRYIILCWRCYRSWDFKTPFWVHLHLSSSLVMCYVCINKLFFFY